MVRTMRAEDREGDPLPNFIIIGAMRSGTTTLARSLGAHPDVFMAPQKEVHFFDRHYERGVDWYRSRFTGAGGERRIGEATPAYMFDATALERMADLVPDALLLSILRNPVDRAYSHYWLERGLGRETLSFREAIEAEPDRLAEDRSPMRINRAYLECSRYLSQLERVCSRYPRSSVHVTILEKLEEEPRRTFREVYAFLGVDPGFAPPTSDLRMNRYQAYRSLTVRRLVRRGRRTLLKRVVGRLNLRRGGRYPPMDPDLREDLVERFRSHNAELGRWLGVDLSRWDR